MQLNFTKMEGLGNDYVYVNCLEQKIENAGALAVLVSDRHFGVGSDGLILIEPSEQADFTMTMYNADGSRSEMCGNGIRCVGKYVYDYGLTDKTKLSIETLAGVKYLDLQLGEDGKVSLVTVNMGAPILEPKQVPFDIEQAGKAAEDMDTEKMICDYPVEIDRQTYRITCVSMGNPHCVSFVEDVESFPLEQIGPVFESHPMFPRRVNAEFCQILDRSHVKMRVWERGTGETLACGTGSCATAVACMLNGKTEDEVTVTLLGGDLQIRWDKEENIVYMTGPAKVVFDGVMEINIQE